MPECPACQARVPAGESSCSRCGAALPAAADLPRQLRELLARGRKLEAIKVYRDATGQGLLESKNVIEALENAAAAETTAGALDDRAAAEIARLFREGHQLAAVELYQARTGAAFGIAIRAVTALATPPGEASKQSSGCSALLLLFSTLIGTLLVALVRGLLG